MYVLCNENTTGTQCIAVLHDGALNQNHNLAHKKKCLLQKCVSMRVKNKQTNKQTNKKRPMTRNWRGVCGPNKTPQKNY